MLQSIDLVGVVILGFNLCNALVIKLSLATTSRRISVYGQKRSKTLLQVICQTTEKWYFYGNDSKVTVKRGPKYSVQAFFRLSRVLIRRATRCCTDIFGTMLKRLYRPPRPLSESEFFVTMLKAGKRSLCTVKTLSNPC